MPNLYCNRTPGPLEKHAFVQAGGSKGHWGRCKVGQNVYFVLYPDTGAPEKCAFAQAEGSRGRWGRCNGALKGPLGALNIWFALTKNSRLSSFESLLARNLLHTTTARGRRMFKGFL